MNSQEYNGGRIIRIALKNFMTYNSLELRPAHSLNLVVGANGTGKSSILCAVCLGLAGKPVFTGRQMKVNEYVAHGCDYAYIEIELDDPRQRHNLVISRKITKEGKSFYQINNKVVKEQEVEKAVRHFNIQVDNLCQFLPQEKVAEFSKMNNRELLESTQQAVGDQQIHSNYKKLIEMRGSRVELDKEYKDVQEKLDQEKRKNEGLEGVVQRHLDRQGHIEKINQCVKAIAVIKYRELNDKRKACRERYNNLVKEKQKLLEANQPKEIEIECTRNANAQIESEIANTTRAVSKLNVAVDQRFDEIKRLDDQVIDAQTDIKRIKEYASERKRKINEKTTLLAALKTQAEELRKIVMEENAHAEQLKAEKHAVFSRKTENEMEKSTLSTNIKVLRNSEKLTIDRLAEYSSIKNKKLNALRERDPYTYKALQWLEQNRGLFKKRIYDPILLLIEAHDAYGAKLLENHIGMRDLTVFLCEDREDTKMLTRILREEQKLPISVAPVLPERLSSYRPEIPLHRLRNEYHFKNYLLDVFKAPEAVCVYLCDLYNLHKVPCGDQEAEQFIRNSSSRIPFKQYYINNYKFQTKYSLYGNKNISVISSQIREKKILLPLNEGMEEEARKQQKKLQSTRSDLQHQMSRYAEFERIGNTIDVELQKLDQKMKSLNENIEKLKQLDASISHKERELDDLKKHVINVPAAEQKTIDTIKDLKKKMKTCLVKLATLYKQLDQGIKSRVELQLMLLVGKAKLQALETNSEKRTQALRIKEREIEEAKQQFFVAKKQKEDQLQKINKLFGIDLSIGENQQACAEFMREMPRDVETLERTISSSKANLNIMDEVDQESINEYEGRKLLISEYERKLSDLEERLTRATTKMEQLKEGWLVPLNAVVKKINATFSKYFERLGCAGEVVLIKGDQSDDFSQYGLSIMVQFRDSARLIELSPAHHSGGECNVGTILFMLSLQEMTRVPFRCVDEINQGMDSSNEREIFNLISESAARSSQYFLLTPKLLHGLEYSSSVKIHIIHNGPMLLLKNWDLQAFIEAARRQQDSDEH